MKLSKAHPARDTRARHSGWSCGVARDTRGLSLRRPLSGDGSGYGDGDGSGSGDGHGYGEWRAEKIVALSLQAETDE